ncbi:M12 family metallopeptidase [Streptomyces sp. NPDC001514]
MEGTMGHVITGSRWRWPYRVIPYTINEGDFGTDPESADHKAIQNAVDAWNDNTILTLRSRTDETSYIEFVKGDESTSCRSKAGMQTGRQQVFCDPSMSEGSLKHEIGHAVGLLHEHQRDDRDSYVTVWIDNVIDDQRRNFAKMGGDGIEVGAYDHGSIMHYGPRALCVEWRYAVPVHRQFSFARPALAGFNNTLHVVHRGHIRSWRDIPLAPADLWHSRWTAGGDWKTDLIPGHQSFAAPALAAFDNALHMVRLSSIPLFPSVLWHSRWTPRSGWQTLAPPNQGTRGAPALAAFDNALHMVGRGPRSNDLWHSRWSAGTGWQPLDPPGQASRAMPALAAFGNALHMVRCGPRSYELWHSQWTATGGWTPAVRITGQKSLFGPALSVLGPELHLTYSFNMMPRIWHSTYDGKSWDPKHRRDNNRTWTGPALATFNGELHSAHVRGGYLQSGQIRHTARDTTLQSITPVDLPPGVTMGQRDGLSAGDIATVASMYSGF